ncbi:sigma-70 family RNA polymerase sigma factor [Paenibacillus tundrae]|uniref:sigma-70 family RNA polymerase sigma factor n=1 Tax=Paenibacillus tundrae TaxID=528187 RepID=UPI0022A9AA97|nr:sigma-70 family RNA polymerase sigma factor [Paenibacillus tundrae]MCZ1264257.1 sigma-70 family RNA polymerase sigma factor [Paenibacillus tundrae]
MRINEDNVVNEMRKRNPRALEFVIQVYGGSLYALARRILSGKGTDQDVEECISDVFTIAWNNIGEFNENKGTFRTWLLILTKYKTLDYYRKLNRVPATKEFNDWIEGSERPDEIFIYKEQNEELIQIIDQLPEIEKSILIKRYFQFESIAQIAEYTGLSNKAVENRLLRLRKLLKQQLIKLREGDGDDYKGQGAR